MAIRAYYPLPWPKEWKKCEKCVVPAVFGEDHCWKHLPSNKRADFKNNLMKKLAGGESFKRGNFLGVDLEGVFLRFADFEEAHLFQTKFRNADLLGANFSNATIMNAEFQEAFLFGASFRKANIHNTSFQWAILPSADFQEASFYETDFRMANLLGGNLSKTDLLTAKVRGVRLGGVNLDGVTHLSWERIYPLGDETSRLFMDAEDAYLRLKNLYSQQGRYEDASKAFYREKLMTKHEMHRKLFGRRLSRVSLKTARKSGKRLYVWLVRGIIRAFQNIGRFFAHNKHKGVRSRWFGYWFFHVFVGFGQKWLWTVVWAALVVVLFGVFYLLGGTSAFDVKHVVKPEWLQYFYFSVVAFTTLGFGDITPKCWWSEVLVIIEVILGYVFLGLIVTIIARRFGR